MNELGVHNYIFTTYSQPQKVNQSEASGSRVPSPQAEACDGSGEVGRSEAPCLPTPATAPNSQCYDIHLPVH